MSLLPPELQERFEGLELVGRGAMGTVIRAHDRRLRRDVAIKLVRAAVSQGEDALRFRREGQLLAGLSHPHVLRVFDAQLAGNQPYLVMEFLDGSTLGEALHEGPLPQSVVAEYLLQANSVARQAC